MIILRKSKNEDISEIIEVANASFSSVREQGFDFRKIMPKIYGEGKDISDSHYVIEDNGKIVSLAGNLQSKIDIGGKAFPFSVIGTVSTLPEYRGKGYMSKVVNSVIDDSEKNECVFSTLTGFRKRYNFFGFEKYTTCYKFVFKNDSIRYLPSDPKISICLYDDDSADIDKIYNIYQESHPHIQRAKDNFIECLRISNADIYIIKHSGRVCGFVSYAKRKSCVQELILEDLTLLPTVVRAILEYNSSYSDITFLVNPLSFSLVNAFDEISEDRILCDYLHIRVYDMMRFLEMLLLLNNEALNHVNSEETYNIDGKTISISINYGKVEINDCENQSCKRYTQREFLRMVLGDGNNDLCRNSKIFPLQFGINEPDLF